MMNPRPSGLRRCPVALLTLPLMFVAGANVSRAQTQDSNLLGYPAAGAPAVATVLSPGAEPRTRLRYKVPKDYRDRMSMNMETQMSMTMDGNAMPAMPLPAMTVGADINVTDVSATGDVTYAVAFTGLSLAGGGDPMMSSMLQGLDADYKTITGTVTISDRGINRAVKFDFSKVSNPQMGQMLGSLSNSMENISMPLPEEAVGVGARWEMKQTVSISGVQTFQKTEYELVSFDGKTLTLKTKVEQMALPQPMSNPAFPAGTEASVKKLAGAGTGTIKMRLDSLVPTSEANMTSTMVMEISVQGNTMAMTTETSVKMSIAPVK